MNLNTAVIYGSTRRDRQGIRAARFFVHQLEERGHEVTLLDPLELELPLLDLRYYEYETGSAPAGIQRGHDVLEAADGFVVVSGEYNHSVPPALKNLLDHYGEEYRRKVAAIVTYSGGSFGGVRNATNLRGILGTLGTVTIPAPFPIPRVQDAFAEDGTPVDEAHVRRAEKFLGEYEWYTAALKAARDGLS